MSEVGTTSGVTDEWAEGHLARTFTGVHANLVDFQAETSARLIAEAGIGPGMDVLDIGSGSGVPALEIARIVGPDGSVVATDPSPIFLDALRANIAAAGLTNIEVVQSSASGLPFDGARFDAATCHMGVMFFADIAKSLAKIRHVLRPGTRVAFAAWGPPADNNFFGTQGAVFSRYMPPPPADAPPPTADTPHPTRFAEAGTLSRVLTDAGFADVRKDAPLLGLKWPGDADSLISFWLDLTRIRERLRPDQIDSLERDLSAALEFFREGDGLRFEARIVIASGAAPP